MTSFLSRLDGNIVVTILEAGWEVAMKVAAFTRAENQTLPALAARIVLSVIAFVAFYVEAAGVLVNSIEYLLQHHWYLLMLACCLVLLLLCAAILSLYEHFWHWQGSSVIMAFLLRRQNRARDVVVEDDREWVEVGKHILVMLGKFLLWVLFVLANTELANYVWHNYAVAHPMYNMEILFVNSLEAAGILVGSAFALLHLYPRFFNWSTIQTYSQVPVHPGSQHQPLQNIL
jgi:hypothetical protein